MSPDKPTRSAVVERDHRIDLLKAISIVMVVFWHLQQGRQEALPFVPEPASVLQFYNYQVSIVAVPVFLLVSLVLFYGRVPQGGPAYVWKRVTRVGTAFLFWVAVQTGLFVAASGSLPELTWRLIQSGGPRMPVESAGGSVFYYLYVLLVLTLIAWAYRSLPKRFRDIVGIVVVMASLLYFLRTNLRAGQIAYFDLANFLLYVPIASWLMDHEGAVVRYRWLLTGAWFALAWLDVALLARGTLVSVYGRPVVAFGAVALIAHVLRYRVPARPAVYFLAANSLGIFATHKYWYAFYTLVAFRLGYSTAGTGVLQPVWLTVVIAAFATTLFSTALAARVPALRRVVT